MREAATCGLVAAIIVDGSFATAKDSPNDIDLILVLRNGHDFSADLRPFEYNVISRRRVRRVFDFDMVLVEEGQSDVDEAVGFFSQVRDRPEVRKGMIRVRL